MNFGDYTITSGFRIPVAVPWDPAFFSSQTGFAACFVRHCPPMANGLSLF